MIDSVSKEAIGARLQRVERAEQGLEPPAVLEEALGDPELPVRERASKAAARRIPPARLVELLSQSESLARRAAAMDALALAGHAALPALSEAVERAARGTLLFVLQVLGRIRAPEALSVLRARAVDPDAMLAQAALESLGRQRDVESLPLMVAALQAEPWIAFTAIGALGQTGDPRAIEPLLALRNDEIYQDAVDAALARLRRAPTDGSHLDA